MATNDTNYSHPIGIRGGDLYRDLSSYHPPEKPYNWYMKRPAKTQGGPILTRDAKVAMLFDHLGIDESNVMEPDAPERKRDTKWLSSRHRDLLGELDLANWEPDRLGWRRVWRPDEVESEWVQRFYSHLFLRLNEFVGVNFGHGNIENATTSIWTTQDFSKHLVHYAQQVARQDNHVGGWDWLLSSGRHRQYLIVGIIGKMLQTHVFDDLLFGAEDSGKAILQSQDEGLIDLEGYHRTDLRGRSVKAILGRGSIPTKFWDAVDVLTTKMAATLLPLIDLMDEHFPEYKNVSLRGFYQDLHYIVAEAGFFSLALRESKDIFRFTWPFPGQAWDLDQDNHDDDIYQRSLDANKRLLEAQQRQQEEQQRQQQEEEQQREQGGNSNNDGSATTPTSDTIPGATAKRVQFIDNIMKRVQPTKAPAATPAAEFGEQIAKVQICLWPMLQRFSTPTPRWEQPPNRDPDWDEPGAQFITLISRARVVYYLGSTDDNAEQAERLPALAHHIASHRGRFCLSRASVRKIIRLAVLTGLGLLALLVLAALVTSVARGVRDTVIGYFLKAAGSVLSAILAPFYKALSLFWSAVPHVIYPFSFAFGGVERVARWIWRVLSAVVRAAWDAATENKQAAPQQPPPVGHRGWSWARGTAAAQTTTAQPSSSGWLRFGERWYPGRV